MNPIRLREIAVPGVTDTDKSIGKYVATLVDDGATLQLAIGGVVNAVLSELEHHKNLGIHTEIFLMASYLS